MNNYDNPKMGQHPCFRPEMMEGAMPNTMMYPEIYYKIQPYIIMACDEMDMYGCMMPTREMMMCMCDRICDNVCKMYPEMATCDIEYQVGTMVDPPQDFDEFGRRRRRGPFRDFIFFLLLSEFFRRRRRF